MTISVEDVIIDDGRPVGDGAQAAARLLAGAPADALIVVADCVRLVVRENLPLPFVPLGAPALGWRADIDERLPGHPGFATPSAAVELLAQRPALAVLPFSSGDQASYFGDGITGEIIAALSANRMLLVIARNSTLRYRDSALPPRQIAAKLAVRYLLCGTVRRAERRLRLVVELVDAVADRVIWSQRYDGADDKVFEFQAEIAASLAGAIDPRVTEAEIARVCMCPLPAWAPMTACCVVCRCRPLFAVKNLLRLGSIFGAPLSLTQATRRRMRTWPGGTTCGLARGAAPPLLQMRRRRRSTRCWRWNSILAMPWWSPSPRISRALSNAG